MLPLRFISALIVRRLRLLLLLALTLLSGAQAWAVPSACTAMWGARANSLAYWNSTIPGWTSVSVFPTGYTAPNAMAGRDSDGRIYFTSKVSSANTSLTYAQFSNNPATITFVSVSPFLQTLTAPLPTYTDTTNVSRSLTPTFISLVGATFDRTQNNLYLYATAAIGDFRVTTTSVVTNTVGLIGLLDPASPGAVSWKILREQPGATGPFFYPLLGNSGDLFARQDDGNFWIATNTPNNRLAQLALDNTGFTLNSATVIGTVGISGLTGNLAGIAVDPKDGAVYLSQGANGNSNTYVLGNFTSDPVTATLRQTNFGTQDSGNCVTQPDPPTISKSINPAGSTGTLGTGTLTITITNPNKVPIFLTRAVTDTLPAQFGIPLTAAAQALTVTCVSDGSPLATRPALTTITSVSTTTLVIASGSIIPGGATSGGSCTFSARYSTTVANFYINTLPAGSLSTVVGTNSVAATASFSLRNTDFSIAKSQQFGSGTTSLTTGSLTLPASQTYTYQLNVVNSASGVTATATFTDTLPALLTPLLTVTAVATGGGTCAATTATVAGPPNRMQILGSAIAIPPGATCTVLIFGRTTNTVVASTNINNTAGLTTTIADRVATNNKATVTTTLSPSTLITISKTNQVTVLVTGQTTAYTITVSNLGVAANGATFLDPPVTGLSCSTASFAVNGAITLTPNPLTMNAFQTTGVVLTAFPSPSTITFGVTCTVTATGS